jgi:hypothetical protein
MDADEFKGQKFHPSSFFWKTSYKEPVKVAQVCRILNALTPEQIEAVKFFAADQCLQEDWNNNAGESA